MCHSHLKLSTIIFDELKVIKIKVSKSRKQFLGILNSSKTRTKNEIFFLRFTDLGYLVAKMVLSWFYTPTFMNRKFWTSFQRFWFIWLKICFWGRVDLRFRLELPQEVIQDKLAAAVQLGKIFFWNNSGSNDQFRNYKYECCWIFDQFDQVLLSSRF